MLKCEQFENRIQDLMDQRTDLGSDPLLDEHAQHCATCRDTLKTYLSLEDSFSGKLPTALLPPVESTPATPSLWRRWTPLAITLSLGILIGGTFGLATGAFWANPSRSGAPPVAESPANTMSSDRGQAVQAPTTIAPHLLAPQPPESNSPIEAVDRSSPRSQPSVEDDRLVVIGSSRFPGISLNQIRQQYPTLNLYYQISTELPGLRTIHQSFSLAWEWIARGLLNDRSAFEDSQ